MFANDGRNTSVMTNLVAVVAVHMFQTALHVARFLFRSLNLLRPKSEREVRTAHRSPAETGKDKKEKKILSK